MANIIEKLILNGVEYEIPSGGGVDAAAVNSLIDARLYAYNRVFSLKSWLYKILNEMDEEDELGLTAGETWEDIVANSTSINLISHSFSVMVMLASSEYALNIVKTDATAMGQLLECWNSVLALFNSEIARKILFGDSTTFTLILNSPLALEYILNNTDAINDILEYWDIEEFIDTTLSDIKDNAKVMEILANNETAVNYIITNYFSTITTSSITLKSFISSKVAVAALTTSTNNSKLQSNVTALYNLVTGDSTNFKQITRTYQDGVANLNNSTKVANSIVFVATGYYSSSSGRTIVWHANGVQAKNAGKTYRPTSVTASNCDAVSFKNCTFTESSNGYAAIAVYQVK